MATLQQLIDDIQTELPYTTATFTDAWICRKMNEIQDKVWRYQSSTEVYEFITTTNPIYSMSSDMRIDMVKRVLVSNSTVNDGTEGYTVYTFCGMDDAFTGNNYYDALGSIGLYPVPSAAGYNVKVFYEPAPMTLSTNTLTNTPSLNSEYHDVYKWHVKELIAKSGNAPDVELANNCAAEKIEVIDQMRMDYYKRKSKLRPQSFDYSEGWNSG